MPRPLTWRRSFLTVLLIYGNAPRAAGRTTNRCGGPPAHSHRERAGLSGRRPSLAHVPTIARAVRGRADWRHQSRPSADRTVYRAVLGRSAEGALAVVRAPATGE